MTRQDLVESIISALQEASIDHVTPQLLRSAGTLVKGLLRRRKPTVSVVSSRRMNAAVRGNRLLRLPKPMSSVDFAGRRVDAHVARIMQGKTEMPFGGVAHGTREGARRHGAQIAVSPMIADLVRTDILPKELRRGTAHGMMQHELLHTADPGLRKSGGAPVALMGLSRLHGEARRKFIAKTPEYVARPEETHAYSALAGRLGMRAYKRAGVSVADTRGMLRSHFGSVHTPGTAERVMGQFTQHPVQAATAASTVNTPAQLVASLPTTGRANVRAKRKFYKELTKGAERAYGETWSPLSTGVQRLHQRINARVKKLGESAAHSWATTGNLHET